LQVVVLLFGVNAAALVFTAFFFAHPHPRNFGTVFAQRSILHTNGANVGAHYASQKNAENYHIAKQYEQEATFHQPRKRKLIICPHVFNPLFFLMLRNKQTSIAAHVILEHVVLFAKTRFSSRTGSCRVSGI